MEEIKDKEAAQVVDVTNVEQEKIEKQVEVIREAELAVASEEVAAPTLSDIIKGTKTITLPQYGEVTITRPTFFVMEEGDKIASSTKRKMLLDKNNPLPTEAELRKLYKAREAWSDADEERIDFLRTKIVSIVREKNDWPNDLDDLGWWNDNITEEFSAAVGMVNMYAESDEIPDEVLENYDNIREDILNKLQKEHSELRSTRTELFSGTVESFSNFERQLYFIIKCFKDKDGNQIWNSIDELKKEDPSVFSQIVSAASRFWSGVDSEEMESFFDALQGDQM